MESKFSLNYTSKQKLQRFLVRALVPRAGIEPARPKALDFESSASTSSATEAFGIGGCKDIVFIESSKQPQIFTYTDF